MEENSQKTGKKTDSFDVSTNDSFSPVNGEIISTDFDINAKSFDSNISTSFERVIKDISFFNKPCNFVLGVGNLRQLPETAYPEVAFWGRSNVGKSSLINALLNKKKLVKVSNTPGRTREINYFSLNDELYLVDLPGYGYAKVSKDLKDIWNKLVVKYLQNAKHLKRIYLLIDSRVGFKEIDFAIMDFLNYYGRSYQIVLTKSDKINKIEMTELTANIAKIIVKHPACHPDFIVSSSSKKLGLDEIKQSILNVM